MRKLVILIIVLVIVSGCDKENEYRSDGTATILMVNGAVGSGIIKVRMNNADGFWSTMPSINYGSGSFMYAERKSIPVSIVGTSDTSVVLVNPAFNFTGGIYSLFFAGQYPNVEGVLKEETAFPYIRLDRTPPAEDSVVNIRFVNLVPNSTGLRIFIPGKSTNEQDNLGYKGIGDFISYSAKPGILNYKFEIRDASTNDSLTTYTFGITTANRFKNVALVVRGLQGSNGSTALNVSTINYFQ